jgi:hypothetical protein
MDNDKFRRRVPLDKLHAPAGYAGPTGRERPGGHWNARIIREMGSRHRKSVKLLTITMCAWCLEQQHFGPGPAGVQTCHVQGCECWCGPTE